MCCHSPQRTQKDRNCAVKYGRAFRSERTKTPTWFCRGRSFNVVPLISWRGLLDYYVVEGPGLDGSLFLDFIQRCVVRGAHAAVCLHTT